MEAKRTTTQENDNIYLVISEGYVTKMYTVFSRARSPYNNNNNNNKRKKKKKRQSVKNTLLAPRAYTHLRA